MADVQGGEFEAKFLDRRSDDQLGRRDALVAASPGATLPSRPTGDGRIDAHPPDGGAQALRRPSLLVGTIGTSSRKG